MSLAMTLQDIRDFVRDHLDVDDEELPNSLLDRFIYDGANRIERSAIALGGRWAFREVEYTLPVLADTQSYDLDTHTSLDDPATLAYVEEVRGQNWTLQPEDHRAMRARYRVSSTATGTPSAWSQWGRFIYLWPTPDTAASYYILGTRKQADWLVVNDSPDFPDEFHELLGWWALNRAAAQQDDLETSEFYRAEFKEILRDRSRPYLLGNDSPVLQMNGASSVYRPRTESGLTYDWEV